ncbi:phage tail tape measure protein [Sphaerisporangium rhizosphaerae]|uniref:Phage tail tape measure protein n=1 Tax=Sphaerisporangium rhizosphaerae TaxID=2269375 RepID=A0ABW2P6R2_9ACTN
MALKVGELVAFASIDDKGITSGVKSVEQAMQRMQADTTRATGAIERMVDSDFAKIAQSIADGLDPQDALADLDRLVAGFQDGMGEMESDARTGGQGVVDELERALADAEKVARREGEKAGEGFGDGTESSGKGRMSGVGDGFMTVLKGLGWAAAGAAIAEQLMDGLASAMDAEEAKQKLYAQLGATGKESERLGKVAGELYAQAYGESVGEVTDAIKHVVQATGGLGKANEETVKGITGDYLNLAEILDEDVSSAIDAARVLVNNGLAKDFTEAGDVILGMYRKLGDGGEDALDTLREYSPLLKTTGVDAKTLAGIFVQAGADSRNFDVIADALKEVQVQVQTMTPAVKSALGDLGLSWKDIQQRFAKGDVTALDDIMDKLREMKDPVEQSQTAAALFAGTFENLGQSLFKIDPSAAVDALGKVDGGLKTAGDTLNDTASNKLESFKRGLEQNVVNFIGGNVLPALEQLWDGFKAGDLDEQLGELGDKIGETFGGIVEDVRGWAEDNQETLEGLKEKYDSVFSAIGEVVSTAVDLISAIWDEWGDEIMSTVTTVLDTVLGFVEGGLELVKGVFETVTGLITGDWEKVWQGIKDVVHGAINGVLNIIDKTMGQITKGWSTSWDDLKKGASKKWDEIEAFVKKIPGQLKAIWDNAGSLLKAAGQAILQGLIDGIKSKINELGNVLKNVTDFIAEHKGPIEKDRELLIPAGHAIMDGLMKGMTDRYPTVERELISMTMKLKKAGVKAMGGNESGSLFGVDAADGEIARLLGGARFGLDVQGIAPEVAPPPTDGRPKGHKTPWGKNDATFDWNPPANPPGSVEPSSYGGGGKPVVNVNMPGAVIREEADAHRLGNEFGFKYLATP